MSVAVVVILLASLASLAGFIYVLCFPPSTNAIVANADWRKHIAVAAAIVPLSAVVATVFGIAASMMVQSVKEGAYSVQEALTPQIIRVVDGIRPVDANVTFSDVQLVAVLMLLAYGSVLVCEHLINIQRLLKVSRRRLLRPEMEELRKMDQSQAETKTGGKKGR